VVGGWLSLLAATTLIDLHRDRAAAAHLRTTAQAATTVTGYRIMVRHLVELIGTIKLVELKVRDVDFALGKLAKRLSTRSVRLARMILIQAIRNAMVNDLAVRNMADLAAVPQESREGRLGDSAASAPREPGPRAGPGWTLRPTPRRARWARAEERQTEAKADR
jgi:hypothetical protein